MKIKFSQSQIVDVVKNHILPLLDSRSILTFTGPLGVGKTSMIKEILGQSGIQDLITSPTFGYVNSYKMQNGLEFNHFDLYRIGSIDEFISAGFDEYLHHSYSKNFIEWPEVIEDVLENPTLRTKVCHIKIDYLDNDLNFRICEINNN